MSQKEGTGITIDPWPRTLEHYRLISEFRPYCFYVDWYYICHLGDIG